MSGDDVNRKVVGELGSEVRGRELSVVVEAAVGGDSGGVGAGAAQVSVVVGAVGDGDVGGVGAGAVQVSLSSGVRSGVMMSIAR